MARCVRYLAEQEVMAGFAVVPTAAGLPTKAFATSSGAVINTHFRINDFLLNTFPPNMKYVYYLMYVAIVRIP